MISSTLISTLSALAVVNAAASYPPIPQDVTTPVQQRIAIAGPNAMSIGWSTYSNTRQSCVSYGTSADNLSNQTCNSNQVTYPTSRTYYHAVSLNGLTPGTTYYYKIVSTNSSIEHFVAPRAPGDQTAFSMAILADLGVYGEDGFTTQKRDTIPQVQPALEHSTIGALANTVNDYELVVHPGDFAYADDWFLKTKNALVGTDAFQAILENFYGQLAPVAGRKPYMASPGNHEAICNEIPVTNLACPEGQRNFTDFMTRFGNAMPYTFDSTSSDCTAQADAQLAKALSNPPFWYSFEYGMAHVVMINTETDFPNAPDAVGAKSGLNGGPFGAPGQQLKFLDADLASVDRSRTPWLIVAGHRPWYSTGDDDSVCDACQTAFEPLFYKYGVDLGVFGHVHNSQRFTSVYNKTVDPNGYSDPLYPAYVVIGGPGNIEGLSATGTNYTGNVFAYDADFSYGRLDFIDAQHLGIKFFESSNGTLLDQSVLYKSHNTQFVRNV